MVTDMTDCDYIIDYFPINLDIDDIDDIFILTFKIPTMFIIDEVFTDIKKPPKKVANPEQISES